MTKEENKIIKDIMYAVKNGTHISDGDKNELQNILIFITKLNERIK